MASDELLLIENAGDNFRGIVFEVHPEGYRSVKDIFEINRNHPRAARNLANCVGNPETELLNPENIDLGRATTLLGRVTKIIQHYKQVS